MKPFAKKLTKPISLEQWPAIECPICGEGTLAIGKPTDYIRPYYKSDLFDERDGDPESIEGTFSAPLVCNAGNCGCTTIAIGDLRFREVLSYSHSDGPDYKEKYTVRRFHPAISVVEITGDVPTPVRDELARVGALVWSDAGAAVTALRASVEHLLDAQGIDREEQTSKGRPRFLSLNERILAFKSKKNPDVGGLLDAVRYVGNAGAHGDPTTAEDVLNVVDIVETALEKLYPPSKHASAAAYAEQIVKDRRRG